MTWRRLYYRFLDGTLRRPVALADRREILSDGEWNRFVGELGERLAAKALKRDGLKVLYRNFRAPKGGEVDIVGRDGELLVFVEVKTRSTDQYSRPVRAVDRGKQLLITKGAMAWLRELNFPDVKFRFDVVEVILEEGEPPRIEHLRNVFQMPSGFLY